jgi:hypothetical protein
MGLFDALKGKTYSRWVDVVDKAGNEKTIIIESNNRYDLEDANIEDYIFARTGQRVKLKKKRRG